MRKLPPFQIVWIAACAATAMCAIASADTVTLKNGEKLDGKIQNETATDLTIEYHVSPSITDSRTVLKTEVAKVEKEQADEIAFQSMKLIKPGPNSFPATEYDQLGDALRGFLAQYPQSAHVAEIQKNLDALEAEKKRVDSGEIKFQDRWLNKEDAQKERVQLNGQAILSFMQGQTQRGDLIGALNSFTQFDKNGAGSRAYPDAIDLALKILPTLKNTADRALTTWQYQKTERAKGMQLLSPTERAEVTAANDRQKKQEEAALAAAAKAGGAWPPLLTDSEKTLNAISAKAATEEKRLAALPVPAMRKSIALTDTARTALDHNDAAAAETALKQAQSLWQANEMVPRLTAAVTTLKTKAAATPAPAATPIPVAAAAPRPAPPAPTTRASTNPPPTDDTPNFFFTGFGMTVTIVCIIAILAAITAFRKVKARANEVLE